MIQAIGRKHRRLDETLRIRLSRAELDDSSEGLDGVAAGAARRGTASRVRVCALACAILGVLVAPGTARAADPFGTEQLLSQADAAVAQATAQISQQAAQAVAEASPAAAPAQAPAKSWSSANAAPAQPLAQAEAAVASAVAEATKVAASVTSAAPEAPSLAATPARRTPQPAAGKARRRHKRDKTPAVRPAPPTGIEEPTSRIVATSRVALSRSAQVGRPDTRQSPKRVAGAEPQRLPPLPSPPRPDMTSSGQAGGQNPPVQLVVGALAAALVFLSFQLLPRALPRPAFRKPRRIALPPWHPG
jgi:hypothetical protein